MKRIILLAFLFHFSLAYAQKTENAPKLVVGIVVDQMKNEFLYRYADQYSEGGFLRLMNEGFYAANHQYTYMPTSTAPGHASIYTGTTPAVHGISANNWYDPHAKEIFYCVGDNSVKSVGLSTSAGQRSPKNLKTTTITDELKLFWNFRSKVISVSLKDRGAILPAGHLANGAYWYNDGVFITSSFYMDELPQWVTDFNNSGLANAYIKKGWQRFSPDLEYKASTADDSPYEMIFAEEDRPVLPKNLKKLAPHNRNADILKLTPFGNSIVLDFALKAIEEEELGKDAITDFLSVSFSSTDEIGHVYGTRAIEVEDTYIRLDADIAKLLNTLDEQIGKDNYIVFLTGDHGSAEVAQFSLDNKLPGGYIDTDSAAKALEEVMLTLHPSGMDLVETLEGNELYFDKEKVAAAGLKISDLAEAVAERFAYFPGIYAAYPTADIVKSASEEFPIKNLKRGIYPAVASDVIWVLNSGWMDYGSVGTQHGTPWKYDTHVPFILYGKGVKKGKIYRETNIRDIAPTLSMILQIPLPSGTTGTPIVEAIE
ncbi:alkaline phosphatase family protein [Cryomorpha ignava]|uniref:Alkaline phosphatase family protein n=1 Tax=Cryomorpha ignava TaxID=101383 RepID=A0A7K3WLC4_9FLAO|nr:alkaline phosphatase PafA [Cryomorpha ignava]NEN22446.1 alkaline phosphatase family protein [Cryomorpha ignava]